MDKSMIVLITGANKGIGYETALELGKMDFTVLLGARDQVRGKKAEETLIKEGVVAHFVQLDVTKQNDIDDAYSRIEKEYGSLDVLINNAGISLEKGALPSQINLSILKDTFETNFFGMFSITKTMLPLLKKSPAGRIVNISSGLGSLAMHSVPGATNLNALAYNSSKTAVNMLTVLFARELKDTKIKINAACPGYTATDLNNFRGIRTVQQAAVIIVRLATLDEDGPTGGYFDENGKVLW